MQSLFKGAAQAGANAAGGTAAGTGAVKDVNTATFMADVIDASYDTPIVVDFWAPWCGPCKQLGPMIEKAVAETNGAVRLVKIDIDQNQDLAMQMRIQSIPAVYAFKDGRPIDAFVGAVPESQIKAFIKKLASAAGAPASPVDEALEQAKAALAEGDVGTAGTFFSHVLKAEPTNVTALAGLGKILVQSGDVERARMFLEQVPADQANHAEVVALKSAIELAEQAAASAGAAGDLEAKLQQDPNDHQARFDLAMAHFGAGQREEAVDQLLEIIKRNRAWNEEAARKQLVKFFEAFGNMDPLTVASRKRLSAILFS
jgi:putative thioredoxin